MLRSPLILALIVFTCCVATAQSLADDLALARGVKLLEATAKDMDALFRDPTSPFDPTTARLSREASVITVYYSSGKCSDTESYGVDQDDWEVEEGKVVMIDITPREDVSLDQLGLGSIKLADEKLYRGRYSDRIHYNKSAGVAVITIGNRVDKVRLFPSSSSNDRLCRDEKIASYYKKASWKRDPRPKYACILRNQPAFVADVEITQVGNRLYSITTSALDPENDVLSYNYRVSAGKITGTGASVVWDLRNASSGTYFILAGVDDGVGVIGKTVTKSVKVD